MICELVRKTQSAGSGTHTEREGALRRGRSLCRSVKAQRRATPPATREMELKPRRTTPYAPRGPAALRVAAGGSDGGDLRAVGGGQATTVPWGTVAQEPWRPEKACAVRVRCPRRGAHLLGRSHRCPPKHRFAARKLTLHVHHQRNR